MNIIGIYPGSFQPPHKGHMQAYDYLKKYTGKNSFIATTDEVDLPNSPLTFQDKQQIWTRHGVPIDKVILVKDPYNAVEITKKFGSDRTAAVFAMAKENADKVLKSYGGYFQLFKGMDTSMEPLSKVVYVLVIPDVNKAINQSFSPEVLRRAFTSDIINDEKKKSVFKQMFGWYDISLYELVSNKFREASVVRERINESSTLIIKNAVKSIVREIMKELVYPSGEDLVSTTISSEPMLSPSEKSREERNMKVKREKEIKDKENELKAMEKETEVFNQKVRNNKTASIPKLRKNIQQMKSGKI